jgi:hypothetical protein
MQIIRIEPLHFNFYCPASGVKLSDEESEVNVKAKSVMAFWVNIEFETPTINNKVLEDDWTAYQKICRKDHGKFPDIIAFEAFLEAYDQPEWIVFRFSRYGAGCTREWWIIDMDTISDE